MFEFFSNLFSTSDFPPRWYCGTWPESLGWLHIGSDLAIFAAYLAIPIVILYFIFKRKDLPFLPIFWLFGLFIFFCGFGHLVEASLFWEPWYRFSGLIKLCTAIVSWCTVIALVKVIPQVLEIPTSAKMLQEMLDATPFAKITFDREGNVRLANRAAYKMFYIKNIKKISDVVSEMDLERFNSWLSKCFASDLREGESQSIQVLALKRAGESFPAEFTFSKIPGDNRDHAALCGIRDFTELKKIEAQQKKYVHKLEVSNEELEEFCHIAAHDLKEPINAVQNHAQFILEDHEDIDEDIKKRLERIIKLTESQRSLVSDLLYFSRIESKDQELDECNINKLIDDIRESCLEHIHESVDLVVAENLPIVKCEAPKIREVFRNLIINSIKYNMSEKKRIEIGVVEDPAETIFFVKDNGIGIEQAFHKKIFKLFKRLHAKDEYGGGTGSGLSFVKKIIERHNGRIWVESAPGEGATFYFTLNEISESKRWGT